jgi:hypothetical protein
MRTVGRIVGVGIAGMRRAMIRIRLRMICGAARVGLLNPGASGTGIVNVTAMMKGAVATAAGEAMTPPRPAPLHLPIPPHQPPPRVHLPHRGVATAKIRRKTGTSRTRPSICLLGLTRKGVGNRIEGKIRSPISLRISSRARGRRGRFLGISSMGFLDPIGRGAVGVGIGEWMRGEIGGVKDV